jgi:predicted phage-related endonuclease
MIKIHEDLLQGSDEWLQTRCGLLTASEMKHIITPAKLAFASNDKSRAHVFEILAQRITQHVEPAYISDDMLRGMEDEATARDIYEETREPVKTVGFITHELRGIKLGYSPDGLVANDGVIEIKSRRAKFQVETIIEDEVPSEYMLQVQTGLLVSGRKWCDFISYSAGLPLFVKRIMADFEMQGKIIDAAVAFESAVAEKMNKYADNMVNYVPTERKKEEGDLVI